MPVKPGTPSRDRRRPPPRNNVTASSAPTPAALQGALLAFNYATPPKSRSPMTMANRPVSLLDSDPVPPPELPEPGSIKDKIAIFSSNSSTFTPNSRPRSAAGSIPDISRQKSPQLLAAGIAAAAKSPAPASRNLSVDVQRAQSQRFGNAPRDDFPRDLPSPIPIRKPMVNPRLLDPYSDEPQGLSPPDSYFDQRPTSPESSTSPQPLQPPPITKPRPPAPRKPSVPRKPSPAVSLPASTDNRFENRRLHDEPPKPPLPLRTKTSASTLPGDRAPALPPRRAATVQDVSEPPPIPRRTKSPAWPSNSSTPSFYSQSLNLSSTSVLGSVTTDVSRDGTADAVAASSLASNRAALHARKSPPPPPPSRRRRSRSRSLLQLQSKKGRTPNSSPGGLRETLRPQAKSDDEGDHRHRHQHRRIINKHPHKHQEGNRKRWRNEVTEKERKRYEGVWAANKGLLITPGLYPPEAMDMVVNLVVRDIWSRSRLPTHVLEQVWNLVDGQKIGLLTRAEFVVGTWLIDRSLGGHKLFTEVPDSVWASVIRVPGISLEHHSKR